MSFKSRKARILSIVREKVAATVFSVAGKVIVTVRDERVKNLGRVYEASLTKTNIVQYIRDITKSGRPSLNGLLFILQIFCVSL